MLAHSDRFYSIIMFQSSYAVSKSKPLRFFFLIVID